MINTLALRLLEDNPHLVVDDVIHPGPLQGSSGSIPP